MWEKGIGNTMGACVGLERWASVEAIPKAYYCRSIIFGDNTDTDFVIVPKD